MALKLYNTLSRKKEDFVPIDRKLVRMYGCGPTVYWYQHIGNMRRYIFEDILKRTLHYNAYKTKHIINITDVGHLASDADEGEDKMVRALRREGLPLTKDAMLTLAEKYEKAFFEDLKKLNILPADKWPKATKHIKDTINIIKKIEKNGYAYETKVGLIFDTSKFKNYSKLGRLNEEQLKSGVRVEVDPERKSPSDFALWITNQPKHIMQWDSPWGTGFPGWHIECTAMSSKYLGEQFDIHTGGEEHIPVHHTNEIAQSEAAFGKCPWVKYWLHMRWLLFSGEKMAKSKGEALRLNHLIERGYDPLDFRYFTLTAHYRTQLNFTFEALDGAKVAHTKLKERILEFKSNNTSKNLKKAEIYKKKFTEAINDDLNTPEAVAVVWKLIKDSEIGNKEKYELIVDFDRILGLDLDKIKKPVKKISPEIKKLVDKRETARKEKNWKLSDKIRDQLKDQGVLVQDTDKGPKITFQ